MKTLSLSAMLLLLMTGMVHAGGGSGWGVRSIDATSFLFYETYRSGHTAGAIYRVVDPAKLEMAKEAVFSMTGFAHLNTHAQIKALNLFIESRPVEVENLTNDQDRLKKLIER